MTDPIWTLAEHFDSVPMPPSPAVSRVLDEWSHLEATFGCITAAKGDGFRFVVAPDVRLWCGVCAFRRAKTERRCVVCHSEVDPVKSAPLVVQANDIVMLCLIHDECEEAANR